MSIVNQDVECYELLYSLGYFLCYLLNYKICTPSDPEILPLCIHSVQPPSTKNYTQNIHNCSAYDRQ